MTLVRVIVYLPLKIVSVANRREHWAARRTRTATHRGTTKMSLAPQLQGARALLSSASASTRVIVRLTRVHPKAAHAIDGHDNLRSAFKACADGVTDALCSCKCLKCSRGSHAQCGAELCVDDADERIEWRYEQSQSTEYGARVEVLAAGSMP